MPAWRASTRYFWEESPFFRLLLPMIVGIFCYDKFHYTNISFYGLVAIAVVLIITFYFLRLFGNGGNVLRSALLFISVSILGYAASYVNDIRNNDSWFGSDLGKYEANVVIITEAPEEKERTWKLMVGVEQYILNDEVKGSSGKAFIYIYKNDSVLDFERGDRLIIPATWQPLKNPGNPHEFDYAKFCNRNNIYYQQFSNKDDVVKIPSTEKQTLSLAERSHDWAMKQLALHVKDKSTLGLLQAMLLGDEINFSDEDRQLYVDTGIIHVVAISGGHIAFLMILITGALFWIKKKKHQSIKLVIALPIVVFYVMIAGAPPSAVRAAVVFSLLAISTFISRDNNPLNTLLAAAFGILLFQPMWLFAVGFQLSFVAVLSLILFYKRIYLLYIPSNKIINFFWQTIAASLAAEILVAPLVIYYFHLLPAAFLIANVVAVMLMGVVMTLGLLIIAFSSVNVLASFFALITTYLVKGFHVVIEYLRLLNPEAFKFLHLNTLEVLLCYLLIAALAIFIIYKSKPALYMSLVNCCLLLLSFNIKQWNALHQEQLIVYNVSRHAHSELLSDCNYLILSESSDSISQKKLDYATKENHVVNKSWGEEKLQQRDLYQFDGKKILFLKNALTDYNTKFQPIDYLVVEYPISDFDAMNLKNIFDYKQLIVTGNQRRKIVEAWKDSCTKNSVDAHFTMVGGAWMVEH